MSTLVNDILSLCNLDKVSPLLNDSINPSSSMSLGALDFTFKKKTSYLEHFTVYQQRFDPELNYSSNLFDYTEEQLKEKFSNQQYHLNINVAGVGKTISHHDSGYTLKDHLPKLIDIVFEKPTFTDFDLENISLIFPGLRYLEKNIIVFEMPPAHRHVCYQEAFRDNVSGFSHREFYIPVPWQIYIATFNDDMRLATVQMYFSSTPLYAIDQSLYVPPIFNFYSDGTLCRPFFEKMEDIEKYPKNYAGIMASAFDWIWNSGFNWDITQNISDYLFNKKFVSMRPFVSDAAKLTIDLMQSINYPINYAADAVQVRQLFTIWQQVPLENILQIEWNSFCIYEDFNYHSYVSYAQNELESFVSDYLANQDLELVSEYETEEDSENDSILTYEHLFNSTIFKRPFHKKILDFNSVFAHAFKKARTHIYSNRLINSSITPKQSFAKRLSNFFAS